MSTTSDPIPDWWTDPRLAFAEGARVGRAAGLLEGVAACQELYGPWKFDAAEVWRGLERRRARDAERAERARRGS